jgi:hypothetical protein
VPVPGGNLAVGEMESKLAAIRCCTHRGRPLGSAEFVQALVGSMKRRLAPQRGGRPPKSCLDARQSELALSTQLQRERVRFSSSAPES